MSHPVCVKARWAQLCPRLAQHRLGFAHLAVILMLFPSFLLCLPSVCSVASYMIHWLLSCYTHNLSMVVSKTWFTHMLWFELNPWFEQKSCFCVKTVFYKKRRFTQKPCSCACASAVCGQDSSFHGGRNRRRLNKIS